MFSFKDYAYEIFTVGKVRNVDVGVAFDMFRADVAAERGQRQNTGNSIPAFNFDTAHKAFKDAGHDAQLVALNEWGTFMDNNYMVACEAFAEGREAMEKLFA